MSTLSSEKSWSQRHTVILVVTVLRIPIAIGLIALMIFTDFSLARTIIALLMLICIELTDFLDGFLARKYNVVSELGATIDPYSDSISRILTYSALAYGGYCLPVLPLAMAFRDITVSYSRILLVRSGKSASAKWSGKIKAGAQAVGAFILLLGPYYWQYTGKNFMGILSCFWSPSH